MLFRRINSTLLAMRDHIDSYLVLDTGSNDTTVATVSRKVTMHDNGLCFEDFFESWVHDESKSREGCKVRKGSVFGHSTVHAGW